MLGRVCIIMIKMEEYYRDKNDVDFKHIRALYVRTGNIGHVLFD